MRRVAVRLGRGRHGEEPGTKPGRRLQHPLERHRDGGKIGEKLENSASLALVVPVEFVPAGRGREVREAFAFIRIRRVSRRHLEKYRRGVAERHVQHARHQRSRG